MLVDDAGRRALPIWIGATEGRSIARGMSKFSMQRPMTAEFLVILLQAIDARVEQVRVESLKGTTFYGVVKIRRGRTESEVDARPSDALAVLADSPIFVAEDVLEQAGTAIPRTARIPAARRGMESILAEMTEVQSRARARQTPPPSQEEFITAKEKVIAAVFGA